MELNREQLTTALQNIVGDDTSQTSIEFVENIMDTFDTLTQRATLNEDVVPRSELDRANEEWALKYRNRFFEPTPVEDIEEKNKTKKNNKLTFDNLFKKE